MYFVSYLVAVDRSDCVTSSVWVIMNIELNSVWTGTVADYFRTVSRICLPFLGEIHDRTGQDSRFRGVNSKETFSEQKSFSQLVYFLLSRSTLLVRPVLLFIHFITLMLVQCHKTGSSCICSF